MPNLHNTSSWVLSITRPFYFVITIPNKLIYKFHRLEDGFLYRFDIYLYIDNNYWHIYIYITN